MNKYIYLCISNCFQACNLLPHYEANFSFVATFSFRCSMFIIYIFQCVGSKLRLVETRQAELDRTRGGRPGNYVLILRNKRTIQKPYTAQVVLDYNQNWFDNFLLVSTASYYVKSVLFVIYKVCNNSFIHRMIREILSTVFTY